MTTTEPCTTGTRIGSAQTTLGDLVDDMHAFVQQQGWYEETSRRPQTARNLATSLTIECAELLECFQWSDHADSESVADELADIVLYAAQLAGVIGVDLDAAVAKKLETNRSRTWDGVPPEGHTISAR